MGLTLATVGGRAAGEAAPAGSLSAVLLRAEPLAVEVDAIPEDWGKEICISGSRSTGLPMSDGTTEKINGYVIHTRRDLVQGVFDLTRPCAVCRTGPGVGRPAVQLRPCLLSP